MANSSRVLTDDTFGPFLHDNGKQVFDFTLLFEDSIMSVLPSAILIAIVPLRIVQLWRKSHKVTASHLQTVKMVSVVR